MQGACAKLVSIQWAGITLISSRVGGTAKNQACNEQSNNLLTDALT